LIILRAVLTAAIRMKNQSCAAALGRNRAERGLHDESPGHVRAHGVSKRFTGEQILDSPV
jgi:hypothetical protein